MTRVNWAWTLLVGGIVLVVGGWYVLGFLAEPSAVDRVRTLLIAIGVGLAGVGVAGGIAGAWMLIVRRR